MRVRKCISQAEWGSLWLQGAHHLYELFGVMRLWMLNSSILFYIQQCLQIQAWRGQAVSSPAWEHYGWGQKCWDLCGSCRFNLVCTHWLTLCCMCGECGLCTAACSGRTVHVCAVFGSFSHAEIIFTIISSMFTAGPEKRKWKRSDISAAAKILLWRTSYPNVLWEGIWSVIWRLIMDI